MFNLYTSHEQKIISTSKNILSDLLEDIDLKSIKSTLILSNLPSPFFDKIIPTNHFVLPYSKLNLNQGTKFDLIVSFFDIGFIEDINKYLMTVVNLMENDGVFMGCFIGEKSFLETRLKIIEIEENVMSKCYNRILPMIRIEDYNKLLHMYGFKNIISFLESIKSNEHDLFKNLKLIQSLKEIFQIVNPPQKQITKEFYKAIKNYEKLYNEEIDLVCFTSSLSTKKFATQLNI